MKISLDELKVLESTETSAASSIDSDETLTAIFKVREPDYIPAGVMVRSRIDEYMFTGSFIASILPELDSDQNVKSVALSKPLQMIE
jgi:hypothetical protein